MSETCDFTAVQESNTLVGSTWQMKDFAGITAQVTDLKTDMDGNVTVYFDRITQVTERYQSREVGHMSLSTFKIYYRPQA